jgi:hypothetical protein
MSKRAPFVVAALFEFDLIGGQKMNLPVSLSFFNPPPHSYCLNDVKGRYFLAGFCLPMRV